MERFYHEGDKILYVFLFLSFGPSADFSPFQFLDLSLKETAVPTVVNTLVEVLVAPCLDYCSSFIDGFCFFTFF